MVKMSRLVENPLFTNEDTDMVIIRDPKVSNMTSKDQCVKGKKVTRTFSEDSQSELIFSCDKCSQSFSDSINLDIHKKNICQDSKDACSESFDNPSFLSTMSKYKETNQTNSQINLCNKSLGIVAKSSKVKSHHDRAKKLNKNAKDLTLSDIEQIESSWKEWNAKKIQRDGVRIQTAICGICFQKFDNLLTLKEHNKTHSTGGGPKKCRLCYYYVSAASDLNRHVIIHIGKTFDLEKLKKEIENRRRKGHDNTSQKNITRKVVNPTGLAKKNIQKVKEGIYQCDICQKSFNHSTNVYLHKKKHGLEKTHECQVCRKIFNKKFQLENHETGHRIEEIVCRFCEDNFNTMLVLKDHIRSRHANVVGSSNHAPNIESSKMSCDSQSFSSKNTVNKKIKNKPLRKYSCNICQKSFPFLSYVLRHRKKHGMENSNECQFCRKLFKSSHELKNHEARHKVDDNKEICDICNVAVLHLQKHKKRHGKSVLECKVCRMICRNLRHFQFHSKVHGNKSGNLNFDMKDQSEEQANNLDHPKPGKEKCKICHKHMSSNLIAKHEKKHGNSKFECQVCFKLFQNGNVLKSHLRLHKGSEPKQIQQDKIRQEVWVSVKKLEDKYKTDQPMTSIILENKKEKKTCKICHSTVLDLIKHMNKHGKSRYECQLCRKLFRFPQEFKLHEKSHNIGEIKCHSCDKKYDSIGDLQEHFKTCHRKNDQTQETISLNSSSISYQETSKEINVNIKKELHHEVMFDDALNDNQSEDSFESSSNMEPVISSVMHVPEDSNQHNQMEDLDIESVYPYIGECVLCPEICKSMLSMTDVLQQIRLHWKSCHSNSQVDDDGDSDGEDYESDIDWDDVVLDDESDESPPDVGSSSIPEEFVDKRDNSALESDIIEPSLDSIKEENIHDNIAVSDEEDNDMHEDFNGQDEQIDTKDGVQEQIAQQPNVPEAQNVSLSNVSVEEALKFFSA